MREKIIILLTWISLCPCLLMASEPYKNSNSSPAVYFPFTIHIEPMARLLLMNIEKDPDSIYIGFEPQVFHDPARGSSMLVIGWRVDGYVDVYHQPGLNPKATSYDIAGKGLNKLIMHEMAGAFFELEEKGVQVNISFEDYLGRNITLMISEKSKKKRKPFDVLAPVGHAAESPSSMPFIMLHDFYFIRKKNTDMMISIEGRVHQADPLPLRIDRQKMYFTRYCTDPVIAFLNPTHYGPLLPLNQQIDYDHYQTRHEIVGQDEKAAVAQMVIAHNGHNINLKFDPPVPDVNSMQEGENMKGKFVLEGRRSSGKLKGEYRFIRENGVVYAQLIPSGGWEPRPDKFSLRIMYTMVSIFKKWPMTYQWEARITLNEGDHPHMQSSWKRIHPN
jgi:hypothetical protein